MTLTCPFCGSTDINKTNIGLSNPYWAWSCQKCHATAPFVVWNTRPLEDALQTQVDICHENFTQAVIDYNALQSELDTVKRSKDGWEQEALLYAKNIENLRQNLKEAVEEIKHDAHSQSYDDTISANEVIDILRSHGLIKEEK